MMMKSLKRYLTRNQLLSNFRYIALLLFCCFSFSAQAASPPVFSFEFSPNTIGSGNETVLTYTIDNSANVTAASDLTFSNTLPSGVTIADSAHVSTTCINADIFAADGGNSINFSNGRIGQGSVCSASVSITSSTIGTHANTIGNLTSSEGNSGAATGDLIVDATYATFAMVFSPSSIVQGDISTLTIDIANPSGSTISSINTSISLPNGLEVASVNNLLSTCTEKSVTAIANSSSIALSGAILLGGSSCQITVDVQNTGSFGDLLVTSSLLVNSSDVGAASAKLEVNRAFAVMSFNPNPVTPGSISTLSMTLTNYDRSSDATNISFSVDLDATISGLVATNLPPSNVCGSGSTLTGTSNISFSGGNIVAGGSCTFDVEVLIPANAAKGAYTNTTSAFTVGGGSNVPTDPVSSILNITQSPQVSMSFKQASYVAGSEALVDFTITNIDATNDATNITFTSMISDLTSVGAGSLTLLPNANDCGVGSTFTGNSPSGSDEMFTVSDANVVAGASCTFTVGITLPEAMGEGTYQLSTSNITSTINGNDITGSQASDTIVVVSAPSLAFSIVEAYAAPSGTINAEFTLTHSLNATTDATAIGFTLDLDTALAGLAYAGAAQSDICGVGSSFSGATILTLAAGTLTPGESCTFSVELTLPVVVTPATYTFTSSNITATVSGLNPTSPAGSDTLVVSGLTLTKEFVDGPFLPGQIIVAKYTIENAATADIATVINFTDKLHQSLSGLSATTLPATPCGAGSTMSGTVSLTFSGGTLNAGESCTFDVGITLPAGAAEGSYISSTSEVSATVGGNNTKSNAATDTLDVETLSVNISSVNAPSTSISPITVNIDFSRDITGFLITDIVVGNGTASNLKGSGKSYTLDVTPTNDGTVTIDLPANVVDDVDDVSVKNPASNQLLIEYVTPIANATPSLVISNPSLTLASSTNVTYNVSYSNAAEVSLTDAYITLNKEGTATATINVSNGTTDSPTVTLSSITGDGSLGISINAGTARNGINLAPSQGPSNTFSVDNTAPTLTISSTSPTTTNGTFVADFDFFDPVSLTPDTSITGFSLSDISVVNGIASNISGGGASYSATITPTNNGIVSVNAVTGSAKDNHGNLSHASNTLSITYDITKPTLIITSPVATVNTTFTATMTFSDGVTGFGVSDLTVNNATLDAFNAVSTSVYTVLVTPTSNGSVSLSANAGVAQNTVGNTNQASNTLSVTYDISKPTLTITSPASAVNAAFTATMTFSDGVTGFDVSDLTVSNATLGTFNASSTSVYSVLVTPTSNGSVSLSANAGVAQNTLGNTNQASNTLSVTYDVSKPTLTITSSANAVNAAFTATMTFSDGVTGFDVSDLTVSNATLGAFNAVSTSVYTVLVTPTSNGSVSLSANAGVAQNTLGNANQASNTLSITYDISKPILAITSPANTVNEAFTATMTFSEGVTGFDISDLTVSNATLGAFNAVSTSVYTVLVTPTSNGSVSLSANAGVAQNTLGNANQASNKLSVNYDASSLVITSTSPLDDDDSVSNDVLISFTFNKNIQAVSGSNKLIEVVNQNTGNKVASFAALSSDIIVSNRTVTFASELQLELGGSYFVKVTPGSFVDANGNTFDGISTSTDFNFTLGNSAPVTVNDQVTVVEDESIDIDVLLNDSDVDGNLAPLTIEIVTIPENGKTAIIEGKVTYKPSTDFVGADSFTYTVKDLTGATSTEATVAIEVINVNDIPTFISEALTTVSAYALYSYQMIATDVDGDELTYNVTGLPLWLTFDGVDTITGTPSTENIGDVSEIKVTVTDDYIDNVVVQVFTLAITNQDETNLELMQYTSSNPVLVGESVELTYVIENNGPVIALLDLLTIELSGISGVSAMPSTCQLDSMNENDVITCDLPEQLGVAETFAITITIPVNTLGSGEIESKVNVSQFGSYTVITDSMFVITTEKLNDEAGVFLEASSTADHAFGDLNLDGLIDLVIVNRRSEANKVLFNLGNGTFELSQTFGDGSDSRDVLLADIDNDGSLDIVVANTGDKASGYYINDGGHFDEIVELGTMRSVGVAVGDFNNDGLLDIVFGNNKEVGNKIFIQPFVPLVQQQNSYNSIKLLSEVDQGLPEIVEVSDTSAVVTGDFNGDDNIDIVFGYDSSSLEIKYNDGLGNFSSKFIETVSDVSIVKVSDVNNDDIEDIIISSTHGSQVVFGSETVNSVISISSISAADIVVSDINNDGLLELLLMSNTGGIVKYNLDSNDEFIRDDVVIASENTTGLSFADVDNDGDLDMFITSEDYDVADELRYNDGEGHFGLQTVDLAVSLSSVSSTLVNNNYQVTVELENTGMAEANDIVLNYEVTNGSLVSVSNDSLDCVLSSGSLRCNILVLAAGDSLSLVLGLEANTLGVAEHAVVISTASVDDNNDNNQASTLVNVKNVVIPKKSSGGSMPIILVLIIMFLCLRKKLTY
jgi:hypothetical protein